MTFDRCVSGTLADAFPLQSKIRRLASSAPTDRPDPELENSLREIGRVLVRVAYGASAVPCFHVQEQRTSMFSVPHRSIRVRPNRSLGRCIQVAFAAYNIILRGLKLGI